MSAPRHQLADELLRRFVATLRSAQLYAAGHPIITRNLEGLSAALQLLHSLESSVVIGLVADEVIVDDMPMAKADALGPLVKRLQQSGIERITFDRGVTAEEVVAFIDAFTSFADRSEDAAVFPAQPHIRVGRVTIGQRVEGSASDMATIKRLYSDAVSIADSVYESARTEGKPDATMART